MPHSAVSPIAVTLRRARDTAGLTQAQLAERADVRQATISELETGKTRRVDLDVLDRLCGALGVDPGDLLERTKAATRKGRA
jgi:transcriptional regulator with XRE-family HTH domain